MDICFWCIIKVLMTAFEISPSEAIIRNFVETKGVSKCHLQWVRAVCYGVGSASSGDLFCH